MGEKGKGLLEKGYKQTCVMLRGDTRECLDRYTKERGISQGAALDTAIKHLMRARQNEKARPFIDFDAWAFQEQRKGG